MKPRDGTFRADYQQSGNKRYWVIKADNTVVAKVLCQANKPELTKSTAMLFASSPKILGALELVVKFVNKEADTTWEEIQTIVTEALQDVRGES